MGLPSEVVKGVVGEGDAMALDVPPLSAGWRGGANRDEEAGNRRRGEESVTLMSDKGDLLTHRGGVMECAYGEKGEHEDGASRDGGDGDGAEGGKRVRMWEFVPKEGENGSQVSGGVTGTWEELQVTK